MDYLCLAAFAVNIVSGIIETVTVVIICKVVVDIKVIPGSWTTLLYSKQ